MRTETAKPDRKTCRWLIKTPVTITGLELVNLYKTGTFADLNGRGNFYAASALYSPFTIYICRKERRVPGKLFT